jgi:hypothetical protein
MRMNISIVSFAIYYLMLGIIAQVRGADSFSSLSDLTNAVPSLALVAPAAGVKIGAFLSAFDPIRLWGGVLLALGLRDVAGFKATAAWITAAVVYLIFALFLMLGAK